MWLAYTSAFWERAEDLTSALRRLQSQFDALAFEACHAQNYDLSVCWDSEQVEYLKDLEARYHEGIEICDLYLGSEISLECLLYELLKLDFQRFIQPLKEYLPDDLKTRFIINVEKGSSSSSEEDSE